MPEWSRKDKDQYEAVKDSAMDSGRSEKAASELAARVVNKRRREEGRTPNTRTQGTGNPHKRLDERTREEVYNRAKQLGIKGRSKMNKSELVDAVRARQ